MYLVPCTGDFVCVASPEPPTHTTAVYRPNKTTKTPSPRTNRARSTASIPPTPPAYHVTASQVKARETSSYGLANTACNARNLRFLPPSDRVVGRFEIVAPVRFGLVCLRLKGTDAANEELRHDNKCVSVDEVACATLQHAEVYLYRSQKSKSRFWARIVL